MDFIHKKIPTNEKVFLQFILSKLSMLKVKSFY